MGDVLLIDKVTGAARRQHRPDAAARRRRRHGHQSTPPSWPRSTVTAEVVKAAKGPKITIMKFKNKTGYRKRQGHRQPLTQVKITAINA